MMRNPVDLDPSKPISRKPHRVDDTPGNLEKLFLALSIARQADVLGVQWFVLLRQGGEGDKEAMSHG